MNEAMLIGRRVEFRACIVAVFTTLLLMSALGANGQVISQPLLSPPHANSTALAITPPHRHEQKTTGSRRQARSSRQAPNSAAMTSNPYVGFYSGSQVDTFSTSSTIQADIFREVIDANGNLIQLYGFGDTPNYPRQAQGFYGGTIDSNGMLVWGFDESFPARPDGAYRITYNESTQYLSFGAIGSAVQTIYYNDGTTATTYGSISLQRSSESLRPLSLRPESAYAEPVDLATGAQSIERSLLTIHGARELTFSVTYQSNLPSSACTIGAGWSHNFEAHVTISADYPGALVFYRDAIHRDSFFPSSTPGVYLSTDPAVVYGKLLANSDGTFTLLRKDQSRLEFDTNGLLVRDVNSIGQAIVVEWANGVISQVVEPVSGKALSFGYSNGILSSVTDPSGRSILLSYGGNYPGLTLSFIVLYDSSGAGVVSATYFSYGADSMMTWAGDRDGRTEFGDSYDQNETVATQTDALGHQTTFAYDDSSEPGVRVTTVTDRNGNTLTYRFDSQYNLLSKQDQTGQVETYTYDSFGNRTSYTNQNGHVTRYTYDQNGNLLTVTDANNGVTTRNYDSLNRLISVTDPANQVTSFAYDSNNNLTLTTDPLGKMTTQVWNNNSLLASRTFSRGGIETYIYNAGLLNQRQDANGNSWVFAYDVDGRVTTQTDPTGAQTTYAYDGMDDETSVTDPLNETRTIAYNSRGWKISQTDPLGNTTSFQYDDNGNLISRTDPAPGGTTSYQYDNEDRLIQTTDPLGHCIGYGRDAAGRLISVSDALGNVQRFQLDGVGHTVKAFDAYSNQIALNAYDSRELLEENTDGAGRVNNWDYDVRGALAYFTDGLSKVTSFSYDPLNRLSQVASPLSNVTGQGFDADGNRTSLVNALQKSTSFSFDLGERLVNVTTASTLQTTYNYNSRNLVQTVTTPSGNVTTNTYDAASRLAQLADGFATTSYQYDQASRIIEVDDNGYGASRQVTKSYDALGRLTSYADDYGNTIGYSYDAAGNLTQLTYPDGKTVSYTYDANNRLETVTDWASRVTTYTYDDNGRLVDTAFPNGTSEARTYDASGKLTQIQDQDTQGNVIYSSTAQIDAAGRLAAEAISPAPAVLTVPAATMTFDADNRLATYNGQAVSFDPDGNMVTGPLPNTAGMSGFSYDARNRLSEADGVSYRYGPEGRRTSWTGYDGVTRSFVIDPSAALDRVLMRTKGTTTTYYVYGLGLIGQEENGAYQQYHFDSRGSTVAITDAGGNVTDRFEYGPYAEPLSHSGGTDTPFQFNGRYGVQTDLNGLLYMRCRYYDPAIERFINQDVLFGDLNPGISLNRFAFANGNPVSLTDPFGLCAQSDDNLYTRARTLGAAIDDAIINGAITIAQNVLNFLGWGSPIDEGQQFYQNTADSLNQFRSPLANAGLYDPSSPMVQGANQIVGELATDSLFLSPFSISGGGLAAESATSVTEGIMGASSSYFDITVGSSVRNIATDVVPEDFATNLSESGFTSEPIGPGTMFTGPQGQQYFLRSFSKSLGSTADFYAPGSTEITLKLRLGIP